MTKLSKPPNFSAIIFDMDGLVLDTEATYVIAWQKATIKMGYEFSEAFFLSLSGLQYQEVEDRLLACCGVDFDLNQFSSLSGKLWREYVSQKGIAVKKGFLNVLAVIKEHDIPFCLATNSRKLNALECLGLANLDSVFPLIITRDDVKQGKPAPDVFLLAAELLKVSLTQSLVIEDSMTGIQAAVNAGAYSVLIPSVHPIEPNAIDLADCFLNDLNELVQIIQAGYVPAV